VIPPRLELTNEHVLAYRRRVGALDQRLAAGGDSLRQVAWAGLQDSMPRAALLSIHARVADTVPSTWEDPSLVQLWGPRFSAYVVAAADRAAFSLGRLPESVARRRSADALADRLETFLAGRRMGYGEVGRGLGVNPNQLRYAAPTGRVLIRWDGARQPTIWTVPPPDVDPWDARLDLARRFVHIFGPTTPEAFATWAGIPSAAARRAFDALADSVVPVRTSIGDAVILASDEPTLRKRPGPTAPARLLPSGDTHVLLQGADRELVVPDRDRRLRLWPSRVWPGGVVIAGEIAGTWRRANADVAIEPWRPFAPRERQAVEAEAASLPLAGLAGSIRVRWSPD
jgi:Winged helix DNA-binding domain